ncbi:MAG TPA: ABC transporter permease [Thermoplasmata archaeon]|nr:ABC transporter permease [Thermoplasmata archaeon]
MIGNPFAGAARIGWMEFWSHLKSPRLIVLVILIALLIFGVSYGMTQSGPSGFGNSIDLNVYPAVRNESGSDHYLVIGWVADQRGVPQAAASVSVYLQDYTNPAYNGTGSLLTTIQTNASGFVVYDAGTTMPKNISYAMKYGDYGLGSVGFYRGMTDNITFNVGRFTWGTTSGPYGSQSSFSFQVITTDGYPATAADVYVDGNFSGHPDANGFYNGPLTEGNHLVNITYQGSRVTQPVMTPPSYGPAYENGADAVLITLVGSFMGLVLPIMAIAVSFDAIARERAQGSLELLLARRIRREGILTGKFLGAFAAIAVPIVAVLLAGIAVVTSISGRAPTLTFALAVFGASLFLIAVYVLLMLLFSTLAKSVGTAVVFGVVTWLFFNLIFSFITTFLLLSSGGFYLSPNYYSTLLTVYLFDPNMVFQLLLGAAVPSTGGGYLFGIVVPTGYLSVAAILLAAALWIAVPFVLTILVFRRKAES